MTQTLIEIKNLQKVFASESILRNLSLKFEKQDFVSILGASGCGKSTLLRLIAGLEEKTSGEILKPKDLRLSFVFQDPCLLPWLTLEENIALPWRLQNKKPAEVSEVLELVNLTKYKAFFPHQLSGGMKMRGSLARALVTKPEILLMDEPFSALDEMTRFRLQDELRKIWLERKMTILFVTHSISESVYLSNRVLFLDNVSGSISCDLKVDLGDSRDQRLKLDPKYNNYVTQLSSSFRQEMF